MEAELLNSRIKEEMDRKRIKMIHMTADKLNTKLRKYDKELH